MTAQSAIPLKWYVPFANGDSSRVELPVTTADPTRASQTLGFPPLTMQPPESGGVPPQGEDFNGGMNQVARIAWWVLNGGGWPYDATFATNSNINGYPNGAKLQSADFRGDWISTADNNQNNPDTNGTNWVPGFQYGVTALTGLTGGTVTLTPAQAAKNSFTLAGTLGSALTIILPTWTKNWTVTNNTTGAFVTIVKTAAGSGVTIPQNSSPTRVSGDGTNIIQAPENVAAATSATHPIQLQQATGRWLSRVIYATAGTFSETPPAGANLAVYDLTGGGGGGGGGQGTTAGQIAAGNGGGAGARVIKRQTNPTTVSIVVGALGAGAVGATNGSPGGNTTIAALSLSAGGGLGGAVGTAGTGGAGAGTTGGTASGGDILMNGQNGFGAFGIASLSIVQSGMGGSGVYGAGGGQSVTYVTGVAATGHGAGGGGGCVPPSNPGGASGGNGSPGIVIIDYYS